MRINCSIAAPSKGDTRTKSGFIWIARLKDEIRILEHCTWTEVYSEITVSNKEMRLFEWVAI